MPGTTPLVSVNMLTSAPAGLSWQVVPTLTANSAEQLAQLATVCQTATSQADVYCRQPLRAMVATETLYGPGQPRVSVDRETGIAGLITRRSPVTQVLAVQVSPRRCFPPQWSLVPAGQYGIRHPLILDAGPAMQTGPGGGNAVDVAPGYIDARQPGGWDILLSDVTGWPHAGLTEDADQGTTTITVDDVTGWATPPAGVAGFIYDGVSTEPASVTEASATVPVQLPELAGTAQAGPGTLTLSSPLQNAHSAGTVISAMPLTVLHSVALLAAVQALETIDGIATQSLNGQMAGGTGALAEQAELWLDDYRRIF